MAMKWQRNSEFSETLSKFQSTGSFYGSTKMRSSSKAAPQYDVEIDRDSKLSARKIVDECDLSNLVSVDTTGRILR